MSSPDKSPEKEGKGNLKPGFGNLVNKLREDTRLMLTLMVAVAVLAGTVRYVIGTQHPRYVEEVVVLRVNATNTTNTVPYITVSPNVTVPVLKNSIATNLYLTNSTPPKNELVATENGTIFFQISGYFNRYPGSSTNPNPYYYGYNSQPSGDIFIYYLTITAYNGTSSESVILPVFATVKYEGQLYFVYQAEGNTPQLRELFGVLKPNEFVAVTFYTNLATSASTYMYSSTVQGYTIW